jgi:transcription initiation factor TFIIB
LSAIPTASVSSSPSIHDSCAPGSLVRDFATGETICSECGLVIDGSIVSDLLKSEQDNPGSGRGAEFWSRDIGDPRAKSGNFGGFSRRDARGRLIPYSNHILFSKRLRFVERNGATTEERSESRIRETLYIVSAALEVPIVVRKRAEKILLEFRESRTTRGRAVALLEIQVIGALVLAHRTMGIPFDTNGAVKKRGVSRPALWRFVAKLKRSVSFPVTPPTASFYVRALTGSIGLSREVAGIAETLLKALPVRPGGRDVGPRTLAAGAVYDASILAGKGRTVVEIARALGVSDASVRIARSAIADEIAKNPADFGAFGWFARK